MPFVQYRGMQLVVPENDSEFLGYFEAVKQHRLVLKSVRHVGSCAIHRVLGARGANPWSGVGRMSVERVQYIPMKSSCIPYSQAFAILPPFRS